MRVAFVSRPVAFVGHPVAFVSLAFSDLRVNLTLVGPALAQCLLVGPAFPDIRLCVAFVGHLVAFLSHPLAFVSHPVAFVGQALAFVGLAFADLRINLTLVGPNFASADFRISVRHVSTVVPAERQAEGLRRADVTTDGQVRALDHKVGDLDRMRYRRSW